MNAHYQHLSSYGCTLSTSKQWWMHIINILVVMDAHYQHLSSDECTLSTSK